MAGIVRFGANAYPVSQVSVRLALNAAPTIRIRFPSANPPAADQLRLQSEMAPGTFETVGGRLEFLTLGFESVERPDGAGGSLRNKLETIGLLLPRTTADWFARKPAAGQGRHTLIYQRGADANGWLFLRRVLGYKFAAAPDAEAFEALFGPRACLWRAPAWDNFDFLTRTLQAVRFHLPTVLGWTARMHESEPLTVVSRAGRVVELDEHWSPPETPLPHRLAGLVPSGACRRRLEFTATNPAGFLQKLVTTGDIQDVAAEIGERLPNGPGVVRMGSRELFCEAVTYTIAGRADVLSVKGEVEICEFPSLPVAAIPPVHLLGGFKGWHDAPLRSGPRDLVAISAEGRDWIMMADNDDAIDPDKPLLSHALTPKAYRDTYGGFYAKHKPGDEFAFAVAPGSVPWVVGARQLYHEPFEKAGLTLNADVVALSVSAKASELEQANAIHLDGRKPQIAMRLDNGSHQVTVDAHGCACKEGACAIRRRQPCDARRVRQGDRHSREHSHRADRLQRSIQGRWF
jgi:hypothetical protein